MSDHGLPARARARVFGIQLTMAPAKEHARKVAKELGVEKGLVYLPGKLEETWEDSDMGPAFRQRR